MMVAESSCCSSLADSEEEFRIRADWDKKESSGSEAAACYPLADGDQGSRRWCLLR